jgi:uncharacterized membrane protein YqiK
MMYIFIGGHTMKEKKAAPAVKTSPAPEDVWMYIQETGRLIREIAVEADRQLAETKKERREAEKQRREAAAEAEKQRREVAAEADRQRREVAAEADKQRREAEKERREAEKEADRQLAETKKERREAAAEADKQLAETKKLIADLTAKTDKQLADVGEKINKLTTHIGAVDERLGDIVEGLMTSNLLEKFKALGYDFDDEIANCTIREKGTKRMLAELDMLLLNGTMALAIEAKARMTVKDVDQHLKHMRILHDNPNNLLRGKKLYGAMAGAKMTKKSRNYAMQRGFFVLEASGDTVKIAMPVGKPAVW